MTDKNSSSFELVYYIDDTETDDATTTISVVCNGPDEGNESSFIEAQDQNVSVVATTR